MLSSMRAPTVGLSSPDEITKAELFMDELKKAFDELVEKTRVARRNTEAHERALTSLKAKHAELSARGIQDSNLRDAMARETQTAKAVRTTLKDSLCAHGEGQTVYRKRIAPDQKLAEADGIAYVP